MQAGLFTASALLPDIIKQNESPKVTSATIIRTRETWELFCGLTIQPTFRNATTHSVFPAKCRLKKSSAEISYWWRVTTQIWTVLLIGWSKFPRETADQTFYSDLESERSSAWNFYARSSDVISQGTSHWVVASWNQYYFSGYDFPPTNQTCLATNQVVTGCGKLL